MTSRTGSTIRKPLLVAPIPVPLTSMIGRDQNVAHVLGLVEDPDIRLVTLSGPGGVGKTRLALEVARQARDGGMFHDGVAFVPLATVSVGDHVLSAVAHAFGWEESDDPFRFLIDTLADRRALLVLDNMEQVIDAGPRLSEVLIHAPGVNALVTSRAVLRVGGEVEVEVPPLAQITPEPGLTVVEIAGSPASALFLRTARTASGGRSLGDADAPAIAEICARLDGLPLAIELAAARMAVLTADHLLARLDRRLPLLTSGARDLPERQQTLRSTIGWSDDLLRPGERILFHRLAVFVGGFSMDAVEAVAAGGDPATVAHGLGGDTPRRSRSPIPTAELLDSLDALVGHHLIHRTALESRETRFGMLQTVREYALERLEASHEWGQMRDRHAAFFAALAVRASKELYGPDQKHWLDLLEAEHDNIRAALTWWLERGHASEAVAFAASLWRFWEIRGFLREGQRWLERVLALPGDVAPSARATALNNLGNLLYRQGELGQAQALYQQVLTVHREHSHSNDVADALNNLGLVASALGDYEGARELHDESLARRRASGDPARLSLGLHNAGENLVDAGLPEEARPLLEAALVIRREREDRRGMAYVQYNLGRAAAATGDHSSLLLLTSALEGFRDAGEKIGMADTLVEIGRVHVEAGHLTEAAEPLREGLQIRLDLGDRRGIVAALEVTAALANARGRADLAARLIGAAETQRETLGSHVPAVYRARHDAMIHAIRRATGTDDFRVDKAAGRDLSVSDVALRALAEIEDILASATGRDLEASLLPSMPAAPLSLPDLVPAKSSPISGAGGLVSPLTARELEVLRLVADGLGDREIAAELHIGVRTASTHVTNILNKLSVPSRAAAAATAVRLGLV